MRNSTDGFTKAQFHVDLANNSVTWPAGHTPHIRSGTDQAGQGTAP